MSSFSWGVSNSAQQRKRRRRRRREGLVPGPPLRAAVRQVVAAASRCTARPESTSRPRTLSVQQVAAATRAAKQGLDFMKIKLDDVLVSSFQSGGRRAGRRSPDRERQPELREDRLPVTSRRAAASRSTSSSTRALRYGGGSRNAAGGAGRCPARAALRTPGRRGRTPRGARRAGFTARRYGRRSAPRPSSSRSRSTSPCRTGGSASVPEEPRDARPAARARPSRPATAAATGRSATARSSSCDSASRPNGRRCCTPRRASSRTTSC